MGGAGAEEARATTNCSASARSRPSSAEPARRSSPNRSASWSRTSTASTSRHRRGRRPSPSRSRSRQGKIPATRRAGNAPPSPPRSRQRAPGPSAAAEATSRKLADARHGLAGQHHQHTWSPPSALAPKYPEESARTLGAPGCNCASFHTHSFPLVINQCLVSRAVFGRGAGIKFCAGSHATEGSVGYLISGVFDWHG